METSGTHMNNDDLLARIAWLYYVEDLTQQEIGDRLYLPRVKVARLLKKAREDGVVEFRIVKPTAHFELERQLRTRFHLKDALVIPAPLNRELLRESLGKAAARHLQGLFHSDMVVGLGMGRTLAEIPQYMEPHQGGNCVFAEMVGGAGRTDLGFDTYNVSWRFAQRCGGIAEHVFSPVVVESSAARSMLLRDSNIVASLDRAAKCDLALVGIGATKDDMVLHQLGYCDQEVADDLRSRGAVGDVIGHFFDRDGQSVHCGIEDRLIALSLDQLHSIPTVIAVAGGSDSKAEAILGALRGQHIDVLITDMHTAQNVIEKQGLGDAS
jgi:DNA-binding transcriptional regulator LsrR (DeoR family)